MADTTVNNGGPAFPSAYPDSEHTSQGMSLRDYYAAHFMAAMLPSLAYIRRDKIQTDRAYSVRAYELADAMLAERDK